MQVLSLHNRDDTRKYGVNLIDAELAKDDLIPVNSKDCHQGKGIGCKGSVCDAFTVFRMYLLILACVKLCSRTYRLYWHVQKILNRF